MLINKVSIDEIVKIFKEKNLKLTLQRITIYSYLLSTCEHPNVDTIYKNVRQSIPTISLATVYKTLNTLVEAGLVRMLNLCEENFRYDANISHHGHIKCNICNKVEDIDLNNSFRNVLSVEKFNIENFDLFIYGTCEECSPSI